MNEYNSYQREANLRRWNKVFDKLQDDILDCYNKGEISKEEMENVITWTQKMRKIKKEGC